jgi:hypothetical protein
MKGAFDGQSKHAAELVEIGAFAEAFVRRSDTLMPKLLAVYIEHFGDLPTFAAGQFGDLEELQQGMLDLMADRFAIEIAANRGGEKLVAAGRACSVLNVALGFMKTTRSNPANAPDFHAAMGVGLELGRTEIWMDWAATGRLDEFERGVRATEDRARGGKARADKDKCRVAEWKSNALAFALVKNGTNPSWSRSKMATEILHHFDWDRPGQRTVEEWLRLEAEQPNGPLRSRSRHSQQAS